MLLVGAGQMAREYVKVLKALEIDFSVVGRSTKNSQIFASQMDVTVHAGGLDVYFTESRVVPKQAIVAVSAEELTACTMRLLQTGVRSILVEKPAGFKKSAIKSLCAYAGAVGARVYVAYNRRYFESVSMLQQHIEIDGGVRSFHFEFTEWSHLIEKLEKPQEVFNFWLLANSSHVIDLAFYLAGKPKQMFCLQSLPISWHPAGSVFSGSGSTEQDALYTYLADWGSAGRWSVEVMTAKGRYKLCPLETLQFQPKGSLTFEYLLTEKELQTNFKPGIYRMVKDFISGTSILPEIDEQYDMLDICYKMAGYDEG